MVHNVLLIPATLACEECDYRTDKMVKLKVHRKMHSGEEQITLFMIAGADYPQN